MTLPVDGKLAADVTGKPLVLSFLSHMHQQFLCSLLKGLVYTFSVVYFPRAGKRGDVLQLERKLRNRALRPRFSLLPPTNL